MGHRQGTGVDERVLTTVPATRVLAQDGRALSRGRGGCENDGAAESGHTRPRLPPMAVSRELRPARSGYKREMASYSEGALLVWNNAQKHVPFYGGRCFPSPASFPFVLVQIYTIVAHPVGLWPFSRASKMGVAFSQNVSAELQNALSCQPEYAMMKS